MNRRTVNIVVFAVLILLGLFYFRQSVTVFYTGNMTPAERSSIEKLQEVINLTEDYYVDDVQWESAVSTAIEGILQSLDPHSVYINETEAASNDENFQGKYQGIGIQYDVIDGYINVISVIPGSPSEDVGLFAGDIITQIDGESAFGLSNADVPKRLKGPKGSTVKIAVSRVGFDEDLNFEITRAEIPIFTINTSFMADDSTGYVWMNRFASTTAAEFEQAVILLEKQGMKQLLVDLRDNGGGFLKEAVKIVGKFVSGHEKVVYTKGRLEGFEEQFFTDNFGKSIDRDYPLVVLINQGSASASEIVAGAIQDYDRGIIAGTGSFGKGLVQNEFMLNDGSRLRLTVSKYYTPSGRLIQRPYENKSVHDYYAFNEVATDSVAADSVNGEIYYTRSGRKVYGGGGIQPDIKINYESYSKSPKLVQKLVAKRLFFEIASQFASENKSIKDDFENYKKHFKVSRSLFTRLKRTSENKDIMFDEEVWSRDRIYIENRLKAEIARSFWSQNEFWQVILQNDNQFKTALTLFKKAKELKTRLSDSKVKLD